MKQLVEHEYRKLVGTTLDSSDVSNIDRIAVVIWAGDPIDRSVRLLHRAILPPSCASPTTPGRPYRSADSDRSDPANFPVYGGAHEHVTNPDVHHV